MILSRAALVERSAEQLLAASAHGAWRSPPVEEGVVLLGERALELLTSPTGVTSLDCCPIKTRTLQ
jgi:hypothetical protein